MSSLSTISCHVPNLIIQIINLTHLLLKHQKVSFVFLFQKFLQKNQTFGPETIFLKLGLSESFDLSMLRACFTQVRYACKCIFGNFRQSVKHGSSLKESTLKNYPRKMKWKSLDRWQFMIFKMIAQFNIEIDKSELSCLKNFCLS